MTRNHSTKDEDGRTAFPGVCAGRGLAAALSLVALMGSLEASTVSVSTVPQGYLSIDFPAGNATTPSVTTFSLPLSGPLPSGFVGPASGQLTGVTANTLTVSSGGWSPGALSQVATPYFIRITSGVAEGQTFQISTGTANTSDTVTVLNQTLDLTTLGIITGANGDTYQIIPGDTLASLFGTSTMGSTSAAGADVVEFVSNGALSDFYYNTTAKQWRKGSLPVDQSNIVIRPDAGITFYRRGATDLQFSILGTVPSTNIQIVVNKTGGTYIGNVFPVDQTILAANYNSLPGWVNNTGSIGTASTITFLTGSLFNPYNYLASVGQWRKGSVPVNENNVTIPAGTPVLITQPSTTSGVSVLTRILPYNLD
jgi:hypothetical protein